MEQNGCSKRDNREKFVYGCTHLCTVRMYVLYRIMDKKFLGLYNLVIALGKKRE